MNRVCFVTGAEDSHDYPSDTPDAFWRVYLPGKALGTAAILGHPRASERALGARVVWIHEPTCFAAASLAEVARQTDKPVVVDFSEDPWARSEIDHAYNSYRLEAIERTLGAATVIVVASAALAPVFARFGLPVVVVEPVIPLGPGWDPLTPTQPPIIGWWNDGRQRGGSAAVAPALRQLLDETDVRIHHYQFAHHAPLMVGAKGEKAKTRASRLGAWLQGDLSAEANLAILRDRFAGSTLSIDCYPVGSYCETASDLPLLRAAALGIPTITTRSEASPGSISAAPPEWAETIQGVLTDPGTRRGLSISARAWAETRSTYDAYEEVLTCPYIT